MKNTKKSKKSNVMSLANVPATIIALALGAAIFAAVMFSLVVYNAIVAIIKAFPEIAATTFSLPIVVITAVISLAVFTIVGIRRIKKASREQGFEEGKKFEQKQHQAQIVEAKRTNDHERGERCFRETVYCLPRKSS